MATCPCPKAWNHDQTLSDFWRKTLTRADSHPPTRSPRPTRAADTRPGLPLITGKVFRSRYHVTIRERALVIPGVAGPRSRQRRPGKELTDEGLDAGRRGRRAGAAGDTGLSPLSGVSGCLMTTKPISQEGVGVPIPGPRKRRGAQFLVRAPRQGKGRGQLLPKGTVNVQPRGLNGHPALLKASSWSARVRIAWRSQVASAALTSAMI